MNERVLAVEVEPYQMLRHAFLAGRHVKGGRGRHKQGTVAATSRAFKVGRLCFNNHTMVKFYVFTTLPHRGRYREAA